MTEPGKPSADSDQETTPGRELLRLKGARKIPREELIQRLRERREEKQRVPTNR